jgi:hypothetical protein
VARVWLPRHARHEQSASRSSSSLPSIEEALAHWQTRWRARCTRLQEVTLHHREVCEHASTVLRH